MIEQDIQLRKPFNLLNGVLSSMPQDVLLGMGQEVAALLRELGGKHTFHPSPEKLAFAMNTGHAVLAQTSDGGLAGYAKMTPWVVDAAGGQYMAESAEAFEAVQTGQLKPVCVEIGSLVVATEHQGNNLGKRLAQHMLEVSEVSYPELPKIAVVTNDNEASLHVFKRLGWDVVSREEAATLLHIDVLYEWPPPSTIFIYRGEVK